MKQCRRIPAAGSPSGSTQKDSASDATASRRPGRSTGFNRELMNCCCSASLENSMRVNRRSVLETFGSVTTCSSGIYQAHSRFAGTDSVRRRFTRANFNVIPDPLHSWLQPNQICSQSSGRSFRYMASQRCDSRIVHRKAHAIQARSNREELLQRSSGAGQQRSSLWGRGFEAQTKGYRNSTRGS